MTDDLPALPEPPGVPKFANELDEALVAGHLSDELKSKVEIAPDDLSKAEWAMRKARALKEERARYDAFVDEAIAPYEAAREAEHRRLAPSIEFFDGLLERWALRVREIDDRHKTMTLPSGTVKTTAHAAQLQIVDEEKVIAWAEETLSEPALGEVVKTTKKAYVKELSKHVRIAQRANGAWVAVDPSTGTYVPGTHVIPPGDPSAKVVL